MKRSKTFLTGCMALAGFALLPFTQAEASPAEFGRLLADNTFTESVKDTYKDAKNDLKDMVDRISGDESSDVQKYRNERAEDLKNYHHKLLEARQEYVESRMEAQKDYLADHKHLPDKEDIQADLNAWPVQKTSVNR